MIIIDVLAVMELVQVKITPGNLGSPGSPPSLEGSLSNCVHCNRKFFSVHFIKHMSILLLYYWFLKIICVLALPTEQLRSRCYRSQRKGFRPAISKNEKSQKIYQNILQQGRRKSWKTFLCQDIAQIYGQIFMRYC